MGGRFGKYGDAKRKAQIRKNRLRPSPPRQRVREKNIERGHKGKKRGRRQSGGYETYVKVARKDRGQRI